MTREYAVGPEHHLWRGGPVKRICQHCGETFEIKRSAVKRGRGKFCSKDCMRNAGSIVKACEVCGKEFRVKRSHDAAGNGRYCSMKCRDAGYVERGLFLGESNPNYVDGQSQTAAYVRRASLLRRTQKAGNGGSYTSEEWEALCAHYGYCCLACGRNDVSLTVDHVVPVVKGGSSDIDNLQPLCKSCNSSKHDAVIDYR